MSSTAIVVERSEMSGRRPIVNRILSFPVAQAALLCVLAVMSARSNLNDPDMWWHLRTGQIIASTHSIPASDLFSYTTNHQASVPQEWLSQLSMYTLFKLGGFSGVAVWLCVAGALLFVSGYLLCCAYTSNPKIGFLGGLTIWMFSTVGFAPRPQMIGYLFLSLELLLIHLGRTRNPKWFFSLPILFALWVNSHGSFMLGLVVAAIFLGASFMPFRAGLLVSRAWAPGVRKVYIAAVAMLPLALLCNPVGIRQILYPVDTLINQPIGLAQVLEWQPLRLVDARGIGLMATIACILIVVIVRQSELMWDELLLLAVGTWLAVSHLRLVFVFGILAAPILCRVLSDFWDGYRAEQDRPWPNLILIAGSVVVAVLAFPDRANIAQQLDRNNPVGAVAYMKTNQLSGPMLNEYVYGGYLIWAAPEFPVFVDGRADVFEWTGVLGDFTQWETFQTDPRQLLDKYRISFCLLARKSPMSTVMALLPGWRLAYQDDNSVIFKRVNSGR